MQEIKVYLASLFVSTFEKKRNIYTRGGFDSLFFRDSKL